MQANRSTGRGYFTRLRFLACYASTLAECWWAGYAVNMAERPTFAARCLAMHLHFRRREQSFRASLARLRQVA